jgi:hypothetical protein
VKIDSIIDKFSELALNLNFKVRMFEKIYTRQEVNMYRKTGSGMTSVRRLAMRTH